jgi:hypothetical protein
MNLQDAIRANATTRDRLRAVVGRMNDADLAREMGDGWTVATLLAHLAFYDLRAVALLDQWQRAGVVTESPLDAETLNRAALPLFRIIPLRAAAELALSAAEAADSRVAELELDPGLLEKIESVQPSINLNRGEHRQHHLRALEQVTVTASPASKPHVRTRTRPSSR